MRLLLDFIPFQHRGGVGGAPSFAKAVYDRVFEQCDTSLQLYATYDASLPVGKQYDYHQIAEQHGVQLVDISKTTVAEQIQALQIDTFFIAVGQFYAEHPLGDISCRVIMFIHDIYDIERGDNWVDFHLYDKHMGSRWQWIKYAINSVSGRWQRQAQKLYAQVMPLYAGSNTLAYTVSEYSRQSLLYYFPELQKEIRICYSPHKQAICNEEVENRQLQELIQSEQPYLLMIAANRRYKNAATLTKVFCRIAEEYPDLHLVTLKYGTSAHERHHDIAFLSDSDLENAYKHARALVFGSFFEGFGYPPVEAMKYGTPTIASNVTSIPEIVGDAGIYFSPYYPADLYRAIKIALTGYFPSQELMNRRLEEITSRQENDLKQLVNELLTI
ncbi:MAG: glycosyltransferase [Bacteroidaceae bacterium]|nr:glycosyltransferase [Bacteroidaceae bacterium]